MAEGIPDYDDLKLRIEPNLSGSYRVFATGPDGSTAEGSFTSPFSATDLDNFLLRVGQPRKAVRAHRSSQMPHAKQFGSKLFDALFQDDIGDLFKISRRAAEEKQRGLRVTLCLTRVPELMDTPWEFLYERPTFLSQSIYTPVVRSLDLKQVPRPTKVTLPIQVLGMVSRPRKYDDLDVESERKKIEQALSTSIRDGLINLRWLDGGTLAELENVIGAADDIHVFHYIGHGGYNEAIGEGHLVFEDGDGGPHFVTGEELGPLLYDERSLRLVVLNACEGARASTSDPFSGVASRLVEFKVPAVIGMQFEITDEAAITFAKRVYTAIAQGYPVDAAVAHARKAIFAAGNDTEFGTPVLFLLGGDGRIFDIENANQDRSPAGAVSDPVADFALELQQDAVSGQPGNHVAWRLTIRNLGASQLTNVVARRSDGKALAPPTQLPPGQRYTVRWSESLEADHQQLVTVSAYNHEGSLISEQIAAHTFVQTDSSTAKTLIVQEPAGDERPLSEGRLLRTVAEVKRSLGKWAPPLSGQGITPSSPERRPPERAEPLSEHSGFCRRCGKKRLSRAKFCRYCGAPQQSGE